MCKHRTAHRMALTTDAEGFRRLYGEHHPAVLAYCARRVGRNDAPDVAAEVFAVAWRRVDDLPDAAAVLPWLYGVAYRVVSHHWRGQSRRRRLDATLAAAPQPHSLGPDVQIVRREEHELVLKAAARLRPRDQEVLRLTVWEELSHEQVASVLDLRVPAVRQRFHRAKKALLKEFERVGGVVSPASKGGAP